MTMDRGTQIAYIPNHVLEEVKKCEDVDDIAILLSQSPDVEYGFITSKPKADKYFCRFWHKGRPGELRTVANSELVWGGNVFEHESVPQSVVDQVLEGMP